MIHVIAVITTKPGKRPEVLKAFHANIPAVLAEDGCIEYRPVIDASNAISAQSPVGEDTFVVIEKWQTMANLEAHSKAAHMAAYAKQVGEHISDRKVHILEDSQ